MMIAKEQDSHLLIVDDEDLILDLLQRQLKDRGYKILTASSGESALQLVKTHPVAVVVSDQSMPGMDGISFLSEVRQFDDGVVLIMLTGNGSLGHAMEAINELKVFSYMIKPCSAPAMQTTIRDAFKHYEMNTAFRATMKRTYQLNEHLTKENAKLADQIKELEAELERLKGARSQAS
jgi:DNA-binding NtrC family response regulator